MDKVSVITVNFNQTDITLDLLRSLQAQDYKNLEVIVVDNGSRINPERQITSNFDNVIFIRSENNLGFAGGNNLGIQNATGDYLFFLNNDTEIPAHTIRNLVAVLKKYPDTGAVCPLIYYHQFPQLAQYAGYTAINTFTGRNSSIGRKKSIKMTDEVKETSLAHGAAMMLPREVIERVGAMPEIYFLYYEELDWGTAIKKAGYTIRVCHNSHILHKESISTGKESPLKTYFQTRNRILFMRRNFGGLNKLAFFLFFGCISVPANIYRYLSRGEWEHLYSFLNGIWWNITNQKDSPKIGYKYEFLKGSGI